MVRYFMLVNTMIKMEFLETLLHVEVTTHSKHKVQNCVDRACGPMRNVMLMTTQLSDLINNEITINTWGTTL